MDKVFKTLKLLAFLFLVGLMIFGGINHFISPEFYDPFIPHFFPKLIVNYVTGFVELIIGILLIIPKYRRTALLFFAGLMILLLPIHIIDVFKVSPAIGSVGLGVVRIFIQFFLIIMAYGLLIKAEKRSS